MIQRWFQIRYISLILGFMLFIALVSGYTVYVTTWVMLGEKLAAVYPQGLLFEIVKKVNLTLIIRLLILTPFVIFVGLILSNRIAGPIYRIKKHLKLVASGNYDMPLKLRQKDELKDVAEGVNKLVSVLKRSRDSKKRAVDDVLGKAEALERAISDDVGNKKGLLEEVSRLKEALVQIKKD